MNSRQKSNLHTAAMVSLAWRGAHLLVAFSLLNAIFLLPNASAQTLDPGRNNADLVNLNVSVFTLNPSQTGVALEQKDFAVFENGEPQEILFFTSSEMPFDLVLLLDLSGSTVDKIDLIRKSSKRFVDAARPSDRIAILTFATDIQVVSRLSSDHAVLKKSIDVIKRPGGATHFWDALRFVVEHVVSQSRAEKRRSAVVVMTDAVDNALPGVFGDGSATSFEDLLRIVQLADTIVLPIYRDTGRETDEHGELKVAYAMARQQLAVLAAESGNVVYQARRGKDLEGVYEQIMRDLSMVYSIGYRPTNKVRDGSWHALRVNVDRAGAVARVKRGYFAK